MQKEFSVFKYQNSQSGHGKPINAMIALNNPFNLGKVEFFPPRILQQSHQWLTPE
jgi:hypothetical protein